jgi:hypothetical protein
MRTKPKVDFCDDDDDEPSGSITARILLDSVIISSLIRDQSKFKFTTVNTTAVGPTVSRAPCNRTVTERIDF